MDTLTVSLNLMRYCQTQNNDKFIELFESNNLDPSMENNLFSINAISSNNVGILSYLLQKGANISNEDMYIQAVSYGVKINMIKFLFDHGVDFISDTEFISDCICDSEKYDIVEFLLKQGIDPNKIENIDDEHLIDIAIQNEYDLEMVKILISFGADPSLDTSKCLSHAIQIGEEKLIRLLLSKGAQKSSVTPEDLSIMLRSNPQPSLIKFLADQEFDFSAINKIKFNKPHIDKICSMLVELGVDLIQLIKIYDEKLNF